MHILFNIIKDKKNNKTNFKKQVRQPRRPRVIAPVCKFTVLVAVSYCVLKIQKLFMTNVKHSSLAAKTTSAALEPVASCFLPCNFLFFLKLSRNGKPTNFSAIVNYN